LSESRHCPRWAKGMDSYAAALVAAAADYEAQDEAAERGLGR
jgi:hypothetical protein